MIFERFPLPRRLGRRPQDSLRERLGPFAEVCSRRQRQAKAWRGVLWGLRPVPPTHPTAFKNQVFFDMLKKSEKCGKMASQGEPKWSQKSQKSQKNAFRVPLEKRTGKKTEIVRILTPSNPLKRAKTNTKTPFSRFHPDTKKSPK